MGEFMPLMNNLTPASLKSLPFKLFTTHFTHLGLKISGNPKFLFKLNFLDMVDKLKGNIRNWKLLPFSKSVYLPLAFSKMQNDPILYD